MTCAINKIDSNVTAIYMAEEECIKTLPGTAEADAVWYEIEANSYLDFGGEVSRTQRAPITFDRQNRMGAVTDIAAAGGFNLDVTQNNMQRALQGFFFADIREPATTKPMNAAQVTVSAVTSGTKTYTVGSGGTAFTAGQLIFCEGFTNAANNGVKTVASSTGTTVVVTETVVTETPASTAKFGRCGREFASADIDIAVTSGIPSLVSTIADFTTMAELIPGAWIFIGGDAVGTTFANNVGFARISTIAANAIVFDDTTWTPVTEAGTGKTIRIFSGSILKNENTRALIKRRSYNIERQLGDGATATQAEYLIGAVPNEFSISIPQSDKVTANLSFVACDTATKTGESGDEIKAGTRVAALGEDAFNTATDIYRTKLAVIDPTTSAPTALFGYVSESSVSISNGISANKAVGVLGAFDMSAGNFTVGGSVDAYFTTIAAVAAVRNGSDVGYSVIASSQNAGFVYDIPLLGLSGGRLNVVKDQPVKLPLTPSGAKNSNGYTLLYTSFAYLPDVAMAG